MLDRKMKNRGNEDIQVVPKIEEDEGNDGEIAFCWVLCCN